MTPPRPEESLSKFQRYRLARRRDGMKLLRVRVPDHSRPGFKVEAARQAAILKAAPNEEEASRFIEATFAWPKGSSAATSSRSSRRAPMASRARRS